MTYELPHGARYEVSVSSTQVSVSLLFTKESLPDDPELHDMFHGEPATFAEITVISPKECEISFFYRIADYISEYIIWLAVRKGDYGMSRTYHLPDDFPSTAVDYEFYEAVNPTWIESEQ